MIDKNPDVIYINREDVISDRMKLMQEAEHWLRKIVKLNALYVGRIRKIEKKLGQLEKLLGE